MCHSPDLELFASNDFQLAYGEAYGGGGAPPVARRWWEMGNHFEAHRLLKRSDILETGFRSSVILLNMGLMM